MLTYDLPKELIAKQPAQPRDAARLMVLDRTQSTLSHKQFRELPALLQPGDCLILNDTKVFPARLQGRKADTGGKVELLLLEAQTENTYRCIGQPAKRLQAGARLEFNHGSLQAEVLREAAGEKTVRFSGEDPEAALKQLGQIPLPPYIDRDLLPQDADWYQTVFAQATGAVAAPTAGLHFTEQLLNQLRHQAIQIFFLTLHVGWGTFKPVGETELKESRLHPERFQIPQKTLDGLAQAQQEGRRILAVGTTVVRTLEGYARTGFSKGTTDLFIREPFEFKLVDGMVTNFHLPGTSLLHLVGAFAGEKRILSAYQEAVRQKYRFYSYGDAMLIL